MATTDISAVIARLKTRIEAVADIGQVWDIDPYSKNDLAPMVTARIDGVDVMRAWWITGPSMVGRTMLAHTAQTLERTWTYQIHGIVGVDPDGAHLVTLRTLALAVTDSIDSDRHLGNTAHRTEPCRWAIAPENRTLLAGTVGVGYVQIHKPVITLSTP